MHYNISHVVGKSLLKCTAIASSVTRLSSIWLKKYNLKIPYLREKYVLAKNWNQFSNGHTLSGKALSSVCFWKIRAFIRRIYILSVHRYKGLLHYNYTHGSRIQKLKTRETIVLQIFPLQCFLYMVLNVLVTYLCKKTFLLAFPSIYFVTLLPAKCAFIVDELIKLYLNKLSKYF